MVDITTSAIMPGQYYTHEFPFRQGNKTHSWIPIKICLDAISGVRIAQADAFALLPQGKHVIVILNGKLGDIDIHCSSIETFSALSVILSKEVAQWRCAIAYQDATFFRLKDDG